MVLRAVARDGCRAQPPLRAAQLLVYEGGDPGIHVDHTEHVVWRLVRNVDLPTLYKCSVVSGVAEEVVEVEPAKPLNVLLREGVVLEVVLVVQIVHALLGCEEGRGLHG